MKNCEFNKIMDGCVEILRRRLTLPKLVIDTSSKSNPDKKIIYATPFDGDKMLHNRINVYVMLLYNDIDCSRDNKCKTMIKIGKDVVVEDIIPVQELESKIIEYNDMLLEVVSEI